MKISNIISIEGCDCQYDAIPYLKQYSTPCYHTDHIDDLFKAPRENVDNKLSSDLPQLPDIVTHWLTAQRPYTTLLLTHW